MSETEVAKRAARRLAIIRHAEEVTGSVAKTCRYYGISRACFYKWRERYEDGTEGLRDRSKRPHFSPKATKQEVIGKIIYLRQHYHFGPQRSPCTSSVATTFKSAPAVSGGSSGA